MITLKAIAPDRKRRHDGGRQPNAGKSRQDFVTLHPGVCPLFVTWRIGARMPQGFHHTEGEAIEWARGRCAPGQRIAILRAEMIGMVEAAQPVVVYTNAAGEK